ncbi:glutathione peroxidase [Microbacterium sp. BWT-B31]|uniref:glutathione peroxidase n=1 Tax=Microbacterium sp. BWT-B31 TaxID=3232072 RepID=UPI003527C50F
MSLTDTPSLTDIPFQTMDGETKTLADYDGKALLIVNVASRCGLAPQYATLERLQQEYGARGLQVLAFPSNQFLQELGSNEAIKQFCSMTYGVTFPVFDRVRVNGRREHPLYTELKKATDASGKAGRVTWNFEKFLVTPGGEVHRFRPHTEPDDPAVIAAIEGAVPA